MVWVGRKWLQCSLLNVSASLTMSMRCPWGCGEPLVWLPSSQLWQVLAFFPADVADDVTTRAFQLESC
jgi:hypothetical protein